MTKTNDLWFQICCSLNSTTNSNFIFKIFDNLVRENSEKKIWNSLSDPVKSLSNLLLQRNVVPWKLWAAVGGLLAIDLILLITWSIVDPLRRQVHNFAKIESDDPEDDIEIQPQLEHCKSTHHTVWLGKIRTVYIKLGYSPSHGFTNSQSLMNLTTRFFWRKQTRLFWKFVIRDWVFKKPFGE